MNFKKNEWVVKFDGNNVHIKFIKPGCYWTGKTWTVTQEFYKACGSHPKFVANKMDADRAANEFSDFVAAATSQGFMLLEDFRGLENQSSDPSLNDPHGLNDERDFERFDFAGKGEVEILFHDLTKTRARVCSLMLGYDNVRYITFEFYDDTSIGQQTGPRQFMVPIYRNAKLAIRRLS